MTVVSDYDALVTALKARADEIGLSYQLIDEIAQLPSGYTGKLFGPSRVKMIGVDSLFPLVWALACEMEIRPSLELAQKMEVYWEKRDELRRRPGVVRRRFSPELRARVMSEIGRIGGSMKKRFIKTPAQRRRMASQRAKRGWITRRARAGSQAAPVSQSSAATVSQASPGSPRRPRTAGTGGPKDRAPRLLSCSPA